MCCLVTGGNGSSVKPPVVDEEAWSSTKASCVLMVGGVTLSKILEKYMPFLLYLIVPPLQCESSLRAGKVLVGQLRWIMGSLALTSEPPHADELQLASFMQQPRERQKTATKHLESWLITSG